MHIRFDIRRKDTYQKKHANYCHQDEYDLYRLYFFLIDQCRDDHHGDRCHIVAQRRDRYAIAVAGKKKDPVEA